MEISLKTDFHGCKTYVSKENARKAIQSKGFDKPELSYLILLTEQGRWLPVFIGQSAVQAGVHFHFHCVSAA